MSRLFAFIRLSRVHFLPLPMLTYAVGIAYAERKGLVIDPRLLLGGLFIELLVQLSVAYVNDYWDMPTDAINPNRTLLSGGSGELTTGVLPPYIALLAAGICQAVAVFFALWMGIPAASWAILFSTLVLAVFYTTPPIKLSWRRFGELTTGFVAALLVPQWAYSLQSGRLSGDLLLISLPLLPLMMALFLTIATPDRLADQQVGKRTLAVTVGEARIAPLYLVLVLLGYLASAFLWADQLPTTATYAGWAFGVPLAVWAWAGLRAPLPETRRSLLIMIVRAALVTLVIVVALNIGLRL